MVIEGSRTMLVKPRLFSDPLHNNKLNKHTLCHNHNSYSSRSTMPVSHHHQQHIDTNNSGAEALLLRLLERRRQQRELKRFTIKHHQQQHQRRTGHQAPAAILPNIIPGLVKNVWKRTATDQWLYQDYHAPEKLLHVIPPDNDDVDDEKDNGQQIPAAEASAAAAPYHHHHHRQGPPLLALRCPAPLPYMGIPLAGAPALGASSSTRPRYLVRPRFPSEG